MLVRVRRTAHQHAGDRQSIPAAWTRNTPAAIRVVRSGRRRDYQGDIGSPPVQRGRAAALRPVWLPGAWRQIRLLHTTDRRCARSVEPEPRLFGFKYGTLK